jgi:hypothetical protein
MSRWKSPREAISRDNDGEAQKGSSRAGSSKCAMGLGLVQTLAGIRSTGRGDGPALLLGEGQRLNLGGAGNQSYASPEAAGSLQSSVSAT